MHFENIIPVSERIRFSKVLTCTYLLYVRLDTNRVYISPRVSIANIKKKKIKRIGETTKENITVLCCKRLDVGKKNIYIFCLILKKKKNKKNENVIESKNTDLPLRVLVKVLEARPEGNYF